MKETLLIVLFIAGACFGSSAQDKKAEIKKLLNIMSSEKQMEKMMDNILNVTKHQLTSKIEGENAKAKLEKMSAYLKEESTTMLQNMINELIKHGKVFQMMSYPNRSHSISEGDGTQKHLSLTFTKFLKEHCAPGGR